MTEFALTYWPMMIFVPAILVIITTLAVITKVMDLRQDRSARTWETAGRTRQLRQPTSVGRW
jgi:hypothetical protein